MLRLWRVVPVWPILLLPLTSPVSAAAGGPTSLTIVVRVRDYAGMPSLPWQIARREVERAFARLELRVSWNILLSDALPAPTPGKPTVTLLILSPAMVQTKCDADHLTITALASSAKAAGRAWVFYDRIAEAGDVSGVKIATLLARTITHELGHLIAGLSHSDYGVMRADAELIPGGFQGFQAPQQRALHDAVTRASTFPFPTLALLTPGPLSSHAAK
jgi:hypothetical protein